MSTNDTLDAAGFKLTVIEKPRARETMSGFGITFWTVYLKSSLNKKHPVWGQGRTLDLAYADYQRRNQVVIVLNTRKT